MRTSNIVIALVLFNAAAGIMVGSGVAQDWGVDPEPGGGTQVDNATNQSKDLTASKGSTSTLFDLFLGVATSLMDVFSLVFAGPLMLANMGAPEWLLTFIFAPIYIVVALDIAHLLTGRDTT